MSMYLHNETISAKQALRMRLIHEICAHSVAATQHRALEIAHLLEGNAYAAHALLAGKAALTAEKAEQWRSTDERIFERRREL